MQYVNCGVDSYRHALSSSLLCLLDLDIDRPPMHNVSKGDP
jgi:hypothetical protein